MPIIKIPEKKNPSKVNICIHFFVQLIREKGNSIYKQVTRGKF
jgi:hypothetical protein